MPQTLLTIRISDSANLQQWRQRLADDFAAVYHYQDMIPSPGDPDLLIPNPETKQQFALRKITEFIRSVHETSKVQLGVHAAQQTATQQAAAENQELLTT